MSEWQREQRANEFGVYILLGMLGVAFGLGVLVGVWL